MSNPYAQRAQIQTLDELREPKSKWWRAQTTSSGDWRRAQILMKLSSDPHDDELRSWWKWWNWAQILMKSTMTSSDDDLSPPSLLQRDCERDRALSHSLWERGERVVEVKSRHSTSYDEPRSRWRRAQTMIIKRRSMISSSLDEIEIRSWWQAQTMISL